PGPGAPGEGPAGGRPRRWVPRLGRRRAPGQRPLAVRCQLLRLPPPARLVPLLELRQDARGEQLERLADVLVAVVPALLDEDRLVDAGFLEDAQVVAHLLGRANGRAAARHRNLVAAEGLPDARPPRHVAAEEVVVAERVAEELEPLEPAPHGLVS